MFVIFKTSNKDFVLNKTQVSAQDEQRLLLQKV